jgi:hypothetical protein
MKRKKILLSFLFTALTILVFILFKPSERKLCRQAYSEVLKMHYKGVVIEKYFDSKNHLAPTVVVNSMQNSFKIIDYRDESGLFDYLKKGDSIVKIENSSIVLIKRNGLNKTFRIIYNCF